MEIRENCSLKALNTFGIDARARYLAEIRSAEELAALLADSRFCNLDKLILGGGSNILFTGDYNGLVIRIGIQGRELISEDNDHCLIRAGAGENWHNLVMYCIDHGYAGIENLSLIPGNAGAAPMQNIGAYGVELKEVFHELEAVFIESGKRRTFNNPECRFGYRDSIFKNELRDKCIITSVTLKLRKKPEFNISYGALEKELVEAGVKELSIRTVSEAVCRIRRSKLPDPALIGNAGSFFKNPVINVHQYEALKREHSDIVGFPDSQGMVKVAAGWLIEKSGWKGKRFDDYGVHARQALVLVNYGKARGKDIYDLSSRIMEDIRKKFGIVLEREVNIV